MEMLRGLSARYRRFALRISILNRAVIGNSLVIVFGAIAGTYFTRHLALLGDLRLVILFSTAGILLTLLVNYVVVKSALNPLRELGHALGKENIEEIQIPAELERDQDQDIHRLVLVVDEMLTRLDKRARQLRAISERAIHAQEEERIRIARSLHDDTAQLISMLIINLERIALIVPPENPDLLQQVTDAHQVATLLLENLRKVIWDLRPSILDDLGLIPAIRWYAQANLKEKGIHVEMKGGIGAMRLPSPLETMLFRILQEALSNILRHANATKVVITLKPEEEYMILEIEDNGCGFDVTQTTGAAVSRKQLGLLGMQERVSLVNGTLQVESAPGHGTTLQIRVPLRIEKMAENDNALAERVE